MTRFTLLLLSLLAACATTEQSAAPDPTAVTQVAPAEPPPPPTEYIGVITTRDTQMISADFRGEIKELDISTSQRVHAGDVIARIDDKDVRSALEKARAEERAAKMEVGAQGARASMLAKQAHSQGILVRAGAAPMAALANAKAEAASAGASTGAAAGRLGAAQVSAKQLEDQLKKAVLTAPIDGVVTVVSARKGQIAESGMLIARIYDTRDMMVRFLVPREDAKKMKAGGRVQLAIEGVDHPIWASITKIAAEVEPPINELMVDADIDDSKIQPDEVRVAANVRVRLANDNRTALTTPTSTPNTVATR